jgi:glutamine synthetase
MKIFQALINYPEKLEILKSGDVFTDKIISSFRTGVEKRWVTEITGRIILITSIKYEAV